MITSPMAGQPRQTPLHVVHERLGAAMTEFAGWRMPLRYSSERTEHLAVRNAAGLFDLSHMGEILVTGPDAGAALDYALTGHLSTLAPGRARYTMICAEDGGVLDDLVVYRTAEQDFMVIANAANTPVVFEQLLDRAGKYGADKYGAGKYGTAVRDATAEYALIAIQGPAAARILAEVTRLDLGTMKYYAGAFGEVAGQRAWVARTGYTGEDGFEVFCDPADAAGVWEALEELGAAAGLVPAGLAARDTLRLEAGMPLYGNELGPDVTPFEANLGRVVKFDKPGDFVGREALAARAAAGPGRVLTGFIAGSRRVPRHGYPVLAGGQACGTVTSGAPSPTLGVPIAMAYVDVSAAEADPEFAIDIRGESVPATVTDLPFYRRSK